MNKNKKKAIKKMVSGSVVASFILVLVALGLAVASIVVSTTVKTEGIVGPTGPDGPGFKGVLPISQGGTNAGAALTNGKFMISSAGQIVEGDSKDTPTFQNLVLTDAFNQLRMGDTTITAPIPPAPRTVTIPSNVGLNSSFVMNQGDSLINGQKDFTSQTLFSASSDQIGFPGLTHKTNLNAPEPAADRTYTLDDIKIDASFVMTNGTQSISGSKTFHNTVLLSAGSNQLRFTGLTNITLSAPAPTASLTYSLPDVKSNASFVMNQGDQNISGIKSFFSKPVMETGMYFTNFAPGYTPSVLDYYEEYSPPGGVIQFQMSGVDISQTTVFKVTRIGNSVSMTLGDMINFNTTGVSSYLECKAIVPVRFRPSFGTRQFISAVIGPTRYVGVLIADHVAGNIAIFPDQIIAATGWGATNNDFNGGFLNFSI